MPRPRLRRRIRFTPDVTYYKPSGVPMRQLEVVELTREELEALRLRHVEGLHQAECAARMNTSRSTFQRILASACRKTSEALISGRAIRIE